MRNNFLTNKLLPILILSLFLGCKAGIDEQAVQGPLPILGEKDIIPNEQNQVDTLYHTIPSFQFIDQDSSQVTNQTFEGKIYVADFFFTSCPTICPVMTIQMHRLYEDLRNIEDVALLSHSIDPQRDSVLHLRKYAAKMGTIDAKRWHFVTGDKDHIYEMAKAYFENAAADPNAPGGFIHSGYFYLIDKQKRIRGLYLGTDPKQVDQLMKDIRTLRNE
jgi:protein SCO1/2